jgi:ABC-type polysaccharide/polyol phosphate export permease
MTAAIGHERHDNHAGPPYAVEQDEQVKFAGWALWDFFQGLRLWRMWWRMSFNEVRRRYKRTILGPLWVTISLLVFAIALSFVWAGLFNQPVTKFLPFLLSGLLPWGMISSSIGEACAVFLSGEALMKSRQFPYTILVYGVLARNTILFGHNLLAFVVIAAFSGVQLGWQTFLLIPGLMLVLLNCGWISVVVAVFCLRFRDFQQLVASILQVAVFVTPIFWEAGQLQGKRAIIVDVNLLHYMVEIVRQPLLGSIAAPRSYLICAGAAIIGWLLAYFLFVRKRHRLVYWL